jgi:hypothetical protein
MPAKTKSTKANLARSNSPLSFWMTTKRVLEEMYIVHLILLLIATSLSAILVMISFQQKNVIDNLSFQLDFTKQLCATQKMENAKKDALASPSPLPVRR